MRKLDRTDLLILGELIRDSRASDREIARALKISQPTVSRRIDNLNKEKMFECGAFPNMRKLGFELLAFTFGNWNRESFPDTKVKEMKEFISRHPCVIFVSTGMGPDQDRMAITVHKSYSDYSRTIEEFKRDWGQYFSSLTSFIVSLQTDNVLKDLSFKTLIDVLLEETT